MQSALNGSESKRYEMVSHESSFRRQMVNVLNIGQVNQSPKGQLHLERKPALYLTRVKSEAFKMIHMANCERLHAEGSLSRARPMVQISQGIPLIDSDGPLQRLFCGELSDVAEEKKAS